MGMVAAVRIFSLPRMVGFGVVAGIGEGRGII
jgi:hypothetical protein